MQILLYIALGFTIFCAVALLCAPMLLRATPEEQRILAVVTSTRIDRRTIGGKERLQATILSLARNLRGRVGLGENPELKQRMLYAGIRDRRSMDIFLTLRRWSIRSSAPSSVRSSPTARSSGSWRSPFSAI